MNRLFPVILDRLVSGNRAAVVLDISKQGRQWFCLLTFRSQCVHCSCESAQPPYCKGYGTSPELALADAVRQLNEYEEASKRVGQWHADTL